MGEKEKEIFTKSRYYELYLHQFEYTEEDKQKDLDRIETKIKHFNHIRHHWRNSKTWLGPKWWYMYGDIINLPEPITVESIIELDKKDNPEWKFRNYKSLSS